MCGIVGYKGTGKTGEILLSCIKNLEYRGYDSIGMAIKSANVIEIRKDIGKIKEVDNKVHFSTMDGDYGIAHTRWATNGGVTKENSHPHSSNDNKIHLVHNGIIENYQELKAELKVKNIECKSDTDSEVIAQYIAYLKENNNLQTFEAFQKTLLKLQGGFAIVMIAIEDKKVYFARRDSPLVIGTKGNTTKEFFLASDVPAFLEYTNEVFYIEDNEYGYIDDELHTFSINDNKEIIRDAKIIEWDIEQAKKGDYDHYTIKEINEQTQTIQKAIIQEKDTFNAAVDILKNAYGIFFVGCGTSYHAAVSSSYIFTHVAKRHVNLTLASEFRNYTEFLTNKTVMVAISQSGETADLLDAVKEAKKKGVTVISIVNVMGSTLMRLSDLTILMNSGPEISVCSTKAYTAELSILLMLAYALAEKEEKGKELIKKTAVEINNLSKQEKNIQEIAEKIKDTHSLFLIGRDHAFPSALEGALKIKEITYIHAEGFAGGELKHGTIALIEQKTPCITIVTNETKKMILSNASEIKARGGYIIGIAQENNEIFDEWIQINDMKNANPISMIVPIQLLAYYISIAKGINPDKPRNLAKSVTVK